MYLGVRTGFYFNPRSPWGERPLGFVAFGGVGDFNPRSPWGERRSGARVSVTNQVFQSTLPVGGATRPRRPSAYGGHISIHAPRGGSDLQRLHGRKANKHFNPRSPWGERPPLR